MQKYPTYKPSNIDWIGEIPNHWKVKKLKYVADKIDEEAITNDLVFAVENIESHTGKLIGLDKELEYEGTIAGFKKGDTIFNKLRPYLAKVYYAESDGGYFGELLTLRGKKEIYPKYLYSTLSSRGFLEIVNSSTEGTKMPRANWETSIKLIHVALPPLQEQQAIVAYLDEKTTLIDELIAKKERKIELLKEQRAALINQAVTKGLNAEVAFKDSKIEWIGEIPMHWEIVRMKFLCQITTGNKDTKDRKEEGEYPFYVRSQTVEKIDSYSFDGEGILTAGDGVGVGKVFHHVNGKFAFHQRVYLLYNFNRIIGRFLFEFIKNNFLTTVEDQNAKSTVDSLRLNMLQDFPVTIPPLSEQQAIVAYLEEQTALIDKKIELESQKIEKLKEYRQSLISNVVTGKIKVV